DDAYRQLLMQQAAKIAEVLATKGVIGRFGIDFLATREPGSDWRAHAIEINLRMGGTTPPFHALEFLTGGHLDPESGLFRCPNGRTKYYAATDNLKSSDYRGLLPEDLFEIIARRRLGFSHATGTGCLFHMIGALSQYGKVGMVCIAENPADARRLFDQAIDVLDEETGGGSHGVQTPLLDRYLKME
ncbi:MAG: peptide ligase PGM1-related protein, partial [Gammaproteobacteria bacterium]|nr:peptide ligase PGM1-related protein [Gammaproteobacteria bacterium]